MGMWFTSQPIHRFLLGLILIYANTCPNSWASSDVRDPRSPETVVFKRFGQSVIEEGLPFWLERRAVIAEPDVEWGSNDNMPEMDEVEGRKDIAVQMAMNQKAEDEVEHLRQLLNDEAARAIYPTAPNAEAPIHVARREDKPSPGGLRQINGFREQMSWQPITIGVICSIFAIIVIVGAVVYYQKIQLAKKRGADDEFGGLRPAKPSPTGSLLLGESTSLSLEGDRKLAHSAQMYHYQHQKQQMLAVERASDAAQVSEAGSESDVEEGDFTVYECPGLATTGQLEVENPLFEADAATNGPSTNGSYGEIIGHSDLEDGSDSTPTTKAAEH